MKEHERQLRDQKLAVAFANGARICDLADQFGLKRLQVYRILKRLGMQMADERDQTSPMWSMSPEDRRWAIWRRAREAAHEARFRQLESQISAKGA